MMEEQNQEKATATQHVTVADAAAPETGNGKKEDKGGGKKEKKTAKPLTPKQLQQRKKLMVYPLMGLLFLGSMWLIFAPSEEQGVNRDTVGAFNADIPLPENDGIIGDKRKAYEQAQAEKQQAEKVRSLEDFAFSEESDTDGVEMELPDSEPEREPFRDYSDKGGGSRSSVTAYRDINRQLGLVLRGAEGGRGKGELKRQVEELTAKLEERERQAGGIDDQVALMEKSYELAAKYMGQNGRDGVAVQVPATGQDGNGLGQPAVAVQAARERTVSGLQQPLERCGVHAAVQPAEELRLQHGGRQRVRYGEEHDTGVHPRGSDDYGRTDGEAPAARTAASGKPCDSAEHARCGYGKGTGGTAGYRGVVHRIPGELAARGAGGV